MKSCSLAFLQPAGDPLAPLAAAPATRKCLDAGKQ